MVLAENEKAVVSFANLFLDQHGDRFRRIHGRWWFLADDGRWSYVGARSAAVRAITERGERFPNIPRFEWIKKQTRNTAGHNRILACIGNMIDTTWLPGPTITPPDASAPPAQSTEPPPGPAYPPPNPNQPHSSAVAADPGGTASPSGQ